MPQTEEVPAAALSFFFGSCAVIQEDRLSGAVCLCHLSVNKKHKMSTSQTLLIHRTRASWSVYHVFSRRAAAKRSAEDAPRVTARMNDAGVSDYTVGVWARTLVWETAVNVRMSVSWGIWQLFLSVFTGIWGSLYFAAPCKGCVCWPMLSSQMDSVDAREKGGWDGLSFGAENCDIVDESDWCELLLVNVVSLGM